MEDRIKNYEKFIEEELNRLNFNRGKVLRTTSDERKKLFEYHKHMVECFQHERLIHMIIMFVFVGLTLISLTFVSYAILTTEFCMLGELWPMFTLAGILFILTAFYIKHYHFLENHTQKLYDRSAEILEYTSPDREKIKSITRKKR